ncbi:MAG: hypothetical protein ACE37K_00730 [Planctomycetota bacterium]
MAKVLQVSELTPYISIFVGRAVGKIAGLAESLVDEIRQELVVGSDHRQEAASISKPNSTPKNSAFLHYTDQQSPSWLAPGAHASIKDVTQHLALAYCCHSHVAIFASEHAAQALIERLLSGRSNSALTDRVRRVRREVLEDALLDGPARTLWLSGVHRRTDVKADGKVLTGTDLHHTLNPIDDQSYHATAARVNASALDNKATGLSQRRSRIWVSKSKSWTEFCAVIRKILAALDAAEKAPKPGGSGFGYLATPVSDLKRAKNAFDVSLVPPELLSAGSAGDANALLDAEWLAYNTEFDVTPTSGANVQAKVLVNGTRLGTVDIDVAQRPRGIELRVTGSPGKNCDKAMFDQVVASCQNERWLRVRYASGVTLSDGALFAMKYRDLPFHNWAWIDFSPSDCKQEKPSKPGKGSKPVFTPDLIGQRNSLFCWIVNNWFGHPKLASSKGWLLCDDGADEIADFVHLDLKPVGLDQPRVTLIHVKASNSDSSSRRVSVSEYEVVCGQAVKNLRLLDQKGLASRLKSKQGKAIARATWKDGRKKNSRADAIKAFESLDANYARRVVIVQPRVTESAHMTATKAVAAGTQTNDADHMRQLNTLLLATESSCRDLAAELVVLGSA